MVMLWSGYPEVAFTGRGNSRTSVSSCPIAFNLIAPFSGRLSTALPQNRAPLRPCAPQHCNRGVPRLAAGLASASPAPPRVCNPRCPVANRCPIVLPRPVRSCPLPGPRQGCDVLWPVHQRREAPSPGSKKQRAALLQPPQHRATWLVHSYPYLVRSKAMVSLGRSADNAKLHRRARRN
jgi:hypothetical protein